jgi:hypothetical protein
MSNIIITFPETRHVDELRFKIFPHGGMDVDFASAQDGHIVGRHLARADVERVYNALGRALKGDTKPEPGPGWAVVPDAEGGDPLNVLGILDDAGVFHYITPSGAHRGTVDYTDFEPGA